MNKKDPISTPKFALPPIGMRIIKSAIGVLLCFLIDQLRGSSSIVFFSQIAVLWCIRDYVSETKKFALQRTVGTIVGAAYGLIILLLHGKIIEWVGEVGYQIIISLSIILVLYTTVVIRQKQASYFSCVVFLSIVINHVTDVNPYLFVWNRFLDTMIGIIVGMVVNMISRPKRRHKNVLYLSGLDDTLLAPGGTLSDYSRVELNRLIEKGVRFTVSTIRTPASLMEPLRGIHLSLPVIAMDGAALYNITENRYEKVYAITPDHCQRIKRYLEERNLSYFANVVIEDTLLIYYQESVQESYNELIRRMRKSPYRNYVNREIPMNENVVYFMLIDQPEKIIQLVKEMQKEPVFSNLKVVHHPSAQMEGCSVLKIYNQNASKENMLDYLKERISVTQTVTFGTIEGRYTYTIAPGDFNRVVKLIRGGAI